MTKNIGLSTIYFNFVMAVRLLRSATITKQRNELIDVEFSKETH
jgi:hypothetical protein